MARGRELSQLGSLINVEDSTKNIGVVHAAPSQKIGIGTISPTSKVDVRGDVVVTGIITASSFVGDGSALTGVGDVVEDTTPQLGGNLDVNSKDITGTGNVNLTGIVTATAFKLTDGSDVAAGAAGTWTATSVGIHTTKNVGIATNSAKVDTALFVDGDARITGILSVGQGTVTIDGDTNTITASTLVGSINAENIDNFPTETDYGNLDSKVNDAFGQQISGAKTFDALDTPTESLATQDFGALT